VRDGADLESALLAFDSRSEAGFKRLHLLLERQTYRLASWRTAADDINWRRFFDINELGGLRVERAAVFEATRQAVRTIERGLVDGLRIDHIDGLADPRGYCRKLRRRVDGLLARGRCCGLEHFPIYVENPRRRRAPAPRLAHRRHHRLRVHEPGVAAATRSGGRSAAGELWSNVSERPAFLKKCARPATVLNASLAGDCESVAQALLQVARNDLMTRDLTLGAIRRALQALVVHYPVYRTYINACGRPAAGRGFFQQALPSARQTWAKPTGRCSSTWRWLGGQAWRRLPPGRARSACATPACVSSN
jgi:(1->4)-alpha-D-glucan 1-alpha-D-glucosylmutase